MKIDMDLIDKTQLLVIQLKNNLELIDRMFQDNGGRSGLPYNVSSDLSNLDASYATWVREPARYILERLSSEQKLKAAEEAKSDPTLHRLDQIIELLKKENKEE